MSLDLTQVVSQVADMAGKLCAGREEHERRLSRALGVVDACSNNLSELKLKVEKSRDKTSWLVPGITDEGLAGKKSAPPSPYRSACWPPTDHISMPTVTGSQSAS